MQFLVDELARLDSSDPFFAGRLDLDRVGIIGFSAGGEVVETCRNNSRVKCAALYSATNIQLSRAGLQKPLLAVLGEIDANYHENHCHFNTVKNNDTIL